MCKEKLRELLVETINNLNEYDLIHLHNEYCIENCYHDEVVEFMESLGELFYGVPLNEFLQRYDITDFNIIDNYFVIKDDGRIISFDDFTTDYSEEIAEMLEYDKDYYIKNLYIKEIVEVLEMYNEEI